MTQEEMIEIKETIEEWIKRPKHVPKHYKKFFIQWLLLNLLYNAKYPGLGREVDRVSEFGRSYNNLFDKIMFKKSYIIALIEGECVGKGKTVSPPLSPIKTATLQLREILGIEGGCENCREEKKANCRSINLTNNKFKPFESIMRIIYQIRCNLFHGDKVILSGEQFERDKILIKSSSSILQIVLNHIVVSIQNNPREISIPKKDLNNEHPSQ